jgi:hypothetical protein
MQLGARGSDSAANSASGGLQAIVLCHLHMPIPAQQTMVVHVAYNNMQPYGTSSLCRSRALMVTQPNPL